MSYDDQVARICRLENAWEVEVYDPPKREPKPLKLGEMSEPYYRDPWKSYAFSSAKEVMAFLTDRLEKLKPGNSEQEYATGFKEATKSKK